MSDLINLLVIALATVVAIFLPYFKNENNKLKDELKTKDSEIKLTKENAEIYKRNSNPDFTSESAKLRARKSKSI